MRTLSRQLLASGALLLLCAALARAHGDDEPAGDGMKGMDMTASQHDTALPGTNINLTMADGNPMPPSYFRTKEYSGLMYGHIALMILAWIVILPLAVMLSVARSKLKIPFQIAFLITNAFGILLSVIYNGETPDLYPGNSHNPAGWAISGIACAWVFMGLISLYTQKPVTRASRAQSRPLLQSSTRNHMSHYKRVSDTSEDTLRWSGDSGHGTDRNTESPYNSSRSHSWHSDMDNFPQRKEYHDEDLDDEQHDPLEKPEILKNGKLDGFCARLAPHLVGRTLKLFNFIHGLLERTILVLGFVAFCTGGAVYGGIFKGGAVYSGLAHWIKGGIFFWYGLFAFGRWMGSFQEYGWAWNRNPNPNAYSCESVESFLIFFYGASNVWLEHLASWGGEWSAIDFQHLSITIMFFGGGLLGMLVESKRVRQLLSVSADSVDRDEHDDDYRTPDSYAVSLNPVPAIIIMLLGIMMSSHTQHNMTASMVHKQWGMLFTAGSLARGVTYLTMWLKPPQSYLPSRPPSELVTAFCLVSGGAIFMASSQNTTDVLIQNHLGAMFIFTVIMGLTCLLLAWEVCVVAFKGWIVERQHRQAGHAKPGRSAA